MRQRWLPGFASRELEEHDPVEPRPRDEWGVAGEGATQGVCEVLPGQLGLFTEERELAGQTMAAIEAGRFEEARLCRDRLVALDPDSRDVRELEFLDEIGVEGYWDRSLEVLAGEWRRHETWLRRNGAVSRLARRGVIVRLLSAHTPCAIVEAVPARLPAIVNFLSDGRNWPSDEVAARSLGLARAIVRDALLSGRASRSTDIEDAEVADLLAEHEPPVRMACLGALRHLWPVPPLDPAGDSSAVETMSDAEPGLEPSDRGARFWRCLRVTVSAPHDAPEAVEARKTMKRLDPDLHAQYMRGRVRRG